MSTESVYVITGTSRGIGLELVRQALLAGHRVFAGVRRPESATDLKNLESKYAGRLTVHQLDVRSDKSVKAFAAEIGSSTRVDVLINNAGVYFDEDGPVATVSPRVVLETFDTNTLGPLRVLQALLPNLHRSPSPVVVNMTSQMGSIDDNRSGSSVAYRMSKTALTMMTKCLVNEEKDLIAMAVHPGWVQTDMGGSGAPVKIEDSANGILHLIASAKPDTKSDLNGKFLTYQGRELPF